MTTLATYIRDQAFTRLTSGSISANWKSTRKFPLPTVQQDQLPVLSVFLLSENMEPDGDENVSVPRFISTVNLAMSVLESADKPDTADGALDPLVDLIEDTLLQDPSFVSLTDANGNALIESFPEIRRSYSFPQQGEAYFIEVRLVLSIKFRCFFEPKAPNALTEVDVDTKPFDGSVQSGTYTTSITLPQ